MAIRVQSNIGTEAAVHDASMTALQTLLSSNGVTISYEDAARIGQELVSFFEALGESNNEETDSA